MRNQILICFFALFISKSMQVGDPYVKCPVIECDTTIFDMQCFQHSGTTPVESIKTFYCPYDHTCNIKHDSHDDIIDKGYAWVTSKYQRSSMPSMKKEDSQVYRKFSEKSCEPIENLPQNLENGRNCEVSMLCKSGFCDPETEKCLGLGEGQSCINHSQCNVKYACQIEKEWPFVSICANLTKIDEPCNEDKECELDSFCWYKTPADAMAIGDNKKCMKMYSQKDGVMYGYKVDAHVKKSLKYQIHENFHLGRYCRSGMAVIHAADNLMKCVQISSIKSNIDSYATKLKAPYECMLPKESEFPDSILKNPGNYMDACKYFYIDGVTKNETLINSDYCECSLMIEKKSDAEDIDPNTIPKLNDGKKRIARQKIMQGRGHCPFPDQSIISKYVKSIKNLSRESIDILHTNDRNNQVAMLELLVIDQGNHSVTNETWSEYVTQNFWIQNWPFIQSNQTYTCVNSILEYSPNNMFKLNARYIRISGLVSGFIALYNIY